MIYIDVDAAVTVPVNIMPLTDDTDFKTRETAIAYNEAGMDLVWNFVTPNGTITQTAVTPTTAGDYDWTHIGDGMYKIEIPANGGASINNDTEGVGYFTGVCTGVLPWRGPDIVFRAAGINDKLIESPYDTTRGLAGTALPAAAADAAGGLLITAAGSADIDTLISTANTTAANVVTVDTVVDAIKVVTDALPAAIPSAATVADAVLEEALAGHVTAGTLGKAIADIETDATAILGDTNEIQGDLADGGRLDLIFDAILVDTATTVPAQISALNNLSAAQVNAEVVDVLATDTYAELGAVPAATSSLAAKLNWVFMLSRNKLTQTATTQTVYADDGTTSVATSTVSDDGTTFTKGEAT